MPRANRYFLPGYTWHITHRCHKQEFLFKFSKDRKRWINWLFEAKNRFNLKVLNYMVTSNHIHLLVTDDPNDKRDVIPNSIKLIAGRTAQEYNIRKKRKGAFWEDRYHATAIENDNHLFRCLFYIDVNMVRTGVVENPFDWKYCGLHEIINPKKRYGIIDHEKLMSLLNFSDFNRFKEKYLFELKEYIKSSDKKRELKWSKNIAVGTKDFLEETKKRLNVKALKRNIHSNNDTFELRETQEMYGNVELIDSENKILWNINADS